MASNVQVSNRQRRVRLDTKWFTATAPELFAAVLENLKLKPVSFLSKKRLDSLARSGILSVVFVSNKEIQKLNKKWRQKDCPTDVLSFPLDMEGACPEVPFEIGELIISVEMAALQAGEYGHSLERELAFLFIHGCLHILGFDHEKAADEKEMCARQKKILNDCGFLR
jgi:probable rRNA maturation factor